MTVVLFIAGLVLLIAGAEFLVRGASKLATMAGISKLVIGLTVVAYGTSFPEITVSALSGIKGEADIAIGNVVGSNIFNVLFILGASALIVPLGITRRLVRIDVPIMIGVSVLLLFMSLNHTVSRLEAIFLLVLGLLYTWWQVRIGKEEVTGEEDKTWENLDRQKRTSVLVLNIGFIVAGLTMLVLGSKWLVDGAVHIARSLGVSELAIALTIVAAGTSLPEAATTIIAAIRKERDIAVGNIIGSNIFNILFVVGISGLFASKSLQVNPAALVFDIPVMIAVTLACLPIFFTGFRIARWEGAVFLAYYAAYVVYLIMTASEHDVLFVFHMIMVWFVIPITLLTLVITTIHAVRVRKEVGQNDQ
jgi:cation:H+ antiporter